MWDNITEQKDTFEYKLQTSTMHVESHIHKCLEISHTLFLHDLMLADKLKSPFHACSHSHIYFVHIWDYSSVRANTRKPAHVYIQVSGKVLHVWLRLVILGNILDSKKEQNHVANTHPKKTTLLQ